MRDLFIIILSGFSKKEEKHDKHKQNHMLMDAIHVVEEASEEVGLNIEPDMGTEPIISPQKGEQKYLADKERREKIAATTKGEIFKTIF